MDHRIEQDGISPTMLTRTEFPGALESTYLSSCMRGLMPASGRKALATARKSPSPRTSPRD